MLKEISIMDEEWDYLMVLDACRYDYFSKLYKGYLQGKLEKVCSPASCTDEWCRKSFKEYYNDVVYISANPYINSKAEVKKFNAKDHFFRVIDVWDYGWDEESETVHPQKVNEAVQNFKDKYLDKRFIIHYLQPHAPYLICNTNAGFPRTRPDTTRGVILAGEIRNTRTRVVNKFVKILASLAKKMGLFGGRPSWKIRELLNLPPETYGDAILRKIGDVGLRQAYIENLKIVLAYVAKLVETLSGNIIVTADHGELLGEDGYYLHFGGTTNSFLREIPWLTIKKKEKRKKVGEKNMIAARARSEKEKIFSKEDEEIVKARLRALGYID